MYVTKRNGSREALCADKINKVVEWACADLNVSISEICMKANIQLFDGISTTQIHEALIKSAADLISEIEQDYQFAAARLLLFKLRKDAYGDFDPPDLNTHIQEMIRDGWYTKELLDIYSYSDIQELEEAIDHNADFDITYAGMKTWETKYLIQDRTTKAVYESPQMAMMLIAMSFFIDDGGNERFTRLEAVKGFYKCLKNSVFSLPTPQMSGLRTPTKQFSSCVLIEAGDDLDEINNADAAIVKYTANKAGIGLNVGSIRGEGAPIRGGEAVHTGLTGLIKKFQASVQFASQGGVRKGSATFFYPIWHYDFNNLIVLKNNKGIDDNRARHVDYGVQLNGFFLKRLATDGNITLFHPNAAGGKLYDYFFSDQKLFEELYTQLESDPNVVRRVFKASEIFTDLMVERASTGRIYIQFVDNTNEDSTFKGPIKQSNLCLEIALPTHPIKNIFDPEDDGEIALCTLAAVNLLVWSTLSPEDQESSLYLLVRGLDNLLDYQDYPVLAAEKTKKRRSLGICVTNLAAWLARNGFRYGDDTSLKALGGLMDSMYGYLVDSSYDLGKERGACEWIEKTNWSKRFLSIAEKTKSFSWEAVGNASDYHLNMRHSTLTAMMPCETSSLILNATNGVEPVRGLTTQITNDKNRITKVAPGCGEWLYERKQDIKPRDYLKTMGILQIFTDQAISSNTFYDPRKFPGGRLPLQTLLEDLIFAYKRGLKTLYYHETLEDDEQNNDCEGGACKI